MAENELINKLVVIGGSAGSLEVIMKLVSGFPLQSNAVFVIVVHRKNDAGSVLVHLLSNKTVLSVKEVEDKELK